MFASLQATAVTPPNGPRADPFRSVAGALAALAVAAAMTQSRLRRRACFGRAHGPRSCEGGAGRGARPGAPQPVPEPGGAGVARQSAAWQPLQPDRPDAGRSARGDGAGGLSPST